MWLKIGSQIPWLLSVKLSSFSLLTLNGHLQSLPRWVNISTHHPSPHCTAAPESGRLRARKSAPKPWPGSEASHETNRIRRNQKVLSMKKKTIDFPLLKKGGAKPPTPGTTQSMPHCSPFVQLRGTAIPVLTVMTVGSKEVMGRVPKVARELGHAVPAQSQSSMVLANHPTSIHPAPSKIQRE